MADVAQATGWAQGVRREVGSVGPVRCYVALTTECWTLDVDAIVVSGGGHTLGGLGRAVQEHYSGADWESVDLRSVTVDHPGVVQVRQPDGVRQIICVTLHDRPEVAPSLPEALRNLPAAVDAALRVAAEHGARRVVLPLLGAGGIGLSPESSAQALVHTVRSALRAYGSAFEAIILLGGSAPDAEVIVEAWQTADDGGSGPSVWREPGGPSLSSSAWTTVRDAVGLALPHGARPEHVLLAALRRTADYPARDVATLLLERLVAKGSAKPEDLLNRLRTTLAVTEPFPQPSNDELAQDQVVTAVLTTAREVTRRFGTTTHVHVRHLLFAVATAPLPADVLEALGVTAAEFTGLLLDAVLEAAPDEPPGLWRDALGLTSGAPKSPLVYSDELAYSMSADLVGAGQGIPLADDHLGVSTYVTMLGTVIAHKDTPLPLSIGLFGEWGSGKSYFMGLLRDQIQELSTSKNGSYRKNIVQIGFNAWTYADTNLWASLGDEIFSQLAGPKAEAAAEEAEAQEKEDLRRQIAQLRQGLSHKLFQARELENAKLRADEQARRLRAQKAAADEATHASVRNLVRAVGRNETIRRKLAGVFKQLGASDEIEQGQLVVAELYRSRAEVNTLRALLGGRYGVALAALAGVFLAAAAGLVASGVPGRWLAGLGFSGLTALLAVGAGAVHQVRRGWSTLAEVLTEARADDLEAGMVAIREAQAQQQDLQAQLDEVRARAGELGRQLAELAPGQRLYTFLAERAGSEDYRSQLGLISTIRRDFEALARLIKKDWPTEPGATAPIDRIVLYIDDLDRCSPKQVVEVLQAVHLLLALDLFVVVVGVDPRWLLHSLKHQYREVLSSPDAASAGAALDPEHHRDLPVPRCRGPARGVRSGRRAARPAHGVSASASRAADRPGSGRRARRNLLPSGAGRLGGRRDRAVAPPGRHGLVQRRQRRPVHGRPRGVDGSAHPVRAGLCPGDADGSGGVPPLGLADRPLLVRARPALHVGPAPGRVPRGLEISRRPVVERPARSSSS